MNIGIYGGTFDPVHKGHVKMLCKVMESVKLGKVIVLPDRIPPHKQSDGLVSGEHRAQMCRIAFSDCENTEVSDWEIKREGKSYSVVTLRHMSEVFAGNRLYFIMGSDMLMSFERWYRCEEILSLSGLICVSRCAEDSPVLEEYADRLRAKGGEVIVVDSEPFEASSTEIRHRLKTGADCSDIMDSRVLGYIRENKLYELDD